MLCNICGNVLNENDKVCQKCGTMVSAGSKGNFEWDLKDFPKPKKIEEIKVDWKEGKLIAKTAGLTYNQSHNAWEEPEEAQELFQFDEKNEEIQGLLDQEYENRPDTSLLHEDSDLQENANEMVLNETPDESLPIGQNTKSAGMKQRNVKDNNKTDLLDEISEKDKPKIQFIEESATKLPPGIRINGQIYELVPEDALTEQEKNQYLMFGTLPPEFYDVNPSGDGFDDADDNQPKFKIDDALLAEDRPDLVIDSDTLAKLELVGTGKQEKFSHTISDVSFTELKHQNDIRARFKKLQEAENQFRRDMERISQFEDSGFGKRKSAIETIDDDSPTFLSLDEEYNRHVQENPTGKTDDSSQAFVVLESEDFEGDLIKQAPYPDSQEKIVKPDPIFEEKFLEEEQVLQDEERLDVPESIEPVAETEELEASMEQRDKEEPTALSDQVFQETDLYMDVSESPHKAEDGKLSGTEIFEITALEELPEFTGEIGSGSDLDKTLSSNDDSIKSMKTKKLVRVRKEEEAPAKPAELEMQTEEGPQDLTKTIIMMSPAPEISVNTNQSDEDFVSQKQIQEKRIVDAVPDHIDEMKAARKEQFGQIEKNLTPKKKAALDRKAAKAEEKELRELRKQKNKEKVYEYHASRFGFFTKLLITVLVIVLVTEFSIIGVKVFAPDSTAAIVINSIEERVVTFVTEKLNKDDAAAQENNTEGNIDGQPDSEAPDLGGEDPNAVDPNTPEQNAA